MIRRARRRAAVQPDEVCNLAAFVGTSFGEPLFTTDVPAMGAWRVLGGDPDCAAERASMRTGATLIDCSRNALVALVVAFKEGATAEEIAQQYPSLELADVYAIIAYYLRRRAEVDAYLTARRSRAAAVRVENESRFDPHGIRERLIGRRRR